MCVRSYVGIEELSHELERKRMKVDRSFYLSRFTAVILKAMMINKLQYLTKFPHNSVDMVTPDHLLVRRTMAAVKDWLASAHPGCCLKGYSADAQSQQPSQGTSICVVC